MITVSNIDRYTTAYSGTKAELLAAKIATDDMFPQGRKRSHYPTTESYDWGAFFSGGHPSGWAGTNRHKGGVYEIHYTHEYWPQTLRIDRDPEELDRAKML